MLKQPTAAQSAAINADDQKIAISASAGSGKTTTMIERIVRILQMKDEHGQPRTTIDQLLVLTFTEESAKDMRKKLKKQLGDQLSPVALQAATIGTFHSFCANIVRAWFTVAGVNPSFTVMDEMASNQLKAQIFEKVVLDNYGAATAAIDWFAATRTLQGLQDVICQINEFLNTRADATAWLKDTALRCYEPDLDRNPAVQALIEHYHQLTTRYRSAIIDLAHPSPEVDLVLAACEQVLSAKTYVALHRLTGLALPKLKKVSEWLDDDYAQFKTLRSGFSDDVLKPIAQQFTATTNQIQAALVADRRIVEQLLFLAQQFDVVYSAKKAEFKQLDFADLEKYALKVLANPDAVAGIRGQFKYIFVDEGQDTNPVQFKIIDLLRGDDKFFYIVGDVKQSIYGFRDCEPELFAKMTTEASIKALHFNQNFRSNDQILRFVNDVFTPLIPNYQSEHAFVLAEQRAHLSTDASAVTIELAPDLNAQMELVYQQIINAHRPWGDIAILSETTRHFAALQKYLAERGVPSVIDRASNAVEEPAVVLLNNFLLAAMNPSNELPYYLTLQYLFHCSNDDLALIRLGKKTVPAIDAKLAEYRTWGRTLSTYEVMTMAATEFNLLNIPAVTAFLSAIRGVSDFDTVARYLYLVEHQLVTINLNVGANVTDAVKIMTIHHAKGLEFPMVILFNMGALWSQHHDDTKIALDKNLGLCVVSVDTATYTQKSQVLRLGIKKQQQDIQLTEKQRLLYVALTRPKEYLYIVGSWQPKVFRLQPNCMLDLINPTNVVVRDDVTPSPVKPTTVQTVTTEKIKLSPVKPSMVLAKQSVTALATNAEPFADTVVPVKMAVPAATTGGKEFGTAFHKQVQYGELPAAVAELVAGYTVYREMPFLYRQDQTIVQGIMDLVAVKDHDAIIVDYKTTRLPVDALVTKYRAQLQLYAAALPQYQVKMYLYSTVHQRLIVVS